MTESAPKPTKNMIEVPFAIMISGTRLEVADDDNKGREAVMGDLRPDEELAQLQLFVSENRDITLKDGLRVNREIGFGSRSNLKADEIDKLEHHFTDDQLRELGLPTSRDKQLGRSVPSSRDTDTDPNDQEARQGEKKPFDEDADGIDKPGDDNFPSANHPEGSGATRPGGIGMRDSRDVKDQPPLGTPPNPQRTGDPTTTRTSAGAVAPEVNKPLTSPPRPQQASTPPRPTMPVPPRRK